MKDHSSITVTTELHVRVSEGDGDRPGIVAIFSVNQPTMVALPLRDEPLVIGRKSESGICLPLDSRISRQHAQVSYDGKELRIVDLGSHNGTFVDGVRVDQVARADLPKALRIGDTILIFVAKMAPFLAKEIEVKNDVVIGPALGLIYEKLAHIAASGSNVLITGATGVGKELAARHFHASGRASAGPFVALNCATIPPLLAERLLFGAQRGAYSGADANTEGYVQAAQGGTLFLDEIAELEPQVQAKLLRVLETREAMPLGATRAKKVDFQLCAATLKDLRGEVDAGRFRADLFHRVGRPEVRVPRLDERLEELPWIVSRELRRLDDRLAATASFIEACALRGWPGNVRELLREVREAVLSAKHEARTFVQANDLPTIDIDHPASGARQAAPMLGRDTTPPSRDKIVAALTSEAGNVSRAARRLGMHRNQLRRWVATQGVDVRSYRQGAPDGSETASAPRVSAADGNSKT